MTTEDRLSENDLDWVYDVLDDILSNHCYDFCDRILKQTNVQSCSKDLLLAIAVITLPAKSKLSNRDEFMNKMKMRFFDIPGILDGLL